MGRCGSFQELKVFLAICCVAYPKSSYRASHPSDGPIARFLSAGCSCARSSLVMPLALDRAVIGRLLLNRLAFVR
jgi:hypothetical protein